MDPVALTYDQARREILHPRRNPRPVRVLLALAALLGAALPGVGEPRPVTPLETPEERERGAARRDAAEEKRRRRQRRPGGSSGLPAGR